MRIIRFSVIAAVLSVGALFLAGCNTAKGTVAGVGTAVGSTAKGAAKDVRAIGNCIKKTDDWIKRNLW